MLSIQVRFKGHAGTPAERGFLYKSTQINVVVEAFTDMRWKSDAGQIIRMPWIYFSKTGTQQAAEKAQVAVKNSQPLSKAPLQQKKGEKKATQVA